MTQLADQDEIDLTQLFSLLWWRKWLPISFSILFILAAWLYAENATKKYTAQTTLQIGLEQANLVSIDDIYVLEARNKEYYSTQIELLKSRSMLQRVITKLSLTSNKLNPIIKKPIEQYLPFLSNAAQANDNLPNNSSALINQLQRMIKISQITGSQLINISVTATQPALAQQIANALADVYMEYHQDSRSQVNDNATNWLVTELSQLKSKLEIAEQSLQTYIQQEDLVDLAGVLSLKSKDIETLAQQQLQMQRQVDELKVKYDAIQATQDPILLLLSNAIPSNALVEATHGALTQLKLKLADLALVYGPKHPKHIALTEEIKATQFTLNQQIKTLIQGVEYQYTTAFKQLNQIKRSFEQAKNEFQTLTMQQNHYRRLQREVTANQELYDTFLKRLQETKATKNMEKAFANIVDYAELNPIPVSPKKSLILVLASLLGAMLGVFCIFIIEFSRKGIRDKEEASQITNLPVLAEIPQIKRRTVNNSALLHHELFNNEYYLESIRTLRTRLKMNYEGANILAITSAMPSEGKSTLALNLAKTFAEMEKVLVIDADLRKPSMAQKLEVPTNRAGLVELMSGQYKLSQCLYRDKTLGFDVLTAGAPCDNPSKLLLSAEFLKLLKALAKHYDRVIIETAPVNLVADAQAISKVADGILFVAQADKTPRGFISNGLHLLEQVNANLLGLVLNQTKQKLSRYQYRQYIKPVVEILPSDNNIIAMPKRFIDINHNELELKRQELLAQYQKLDKKPRRLIELKKRINNRN
ncbi:polysaccharide biosynthesis tyrosine autokinase [Catenovulum sp. 2E275]|uniref:GumC family protein n=1 Tax=Catenovulum sp. 2E275 TaxID=2980497 RepID=UPI0021D368B8|nr:polysaccharide biosynthesis tyrosine autokinase [Catenovulum sp. 2E275]MCU4676595.1 polysaccharide biosynthesis tyrosine autokinase [Catenovulum sp. 2E275]